MKSSPKEVAIGDTISAFSWKGKKYVNRIRGFPRELDENLAFLGYYAAYSDNSLSTFREK
jgi:hypothetical protein